MQKYLCPNCREEISNKGCITDNCHCGGEVIHSFWECDNCKICLYNEYWDCWDSELLEDFWYIIPKDSFENALFKISKCPDPTSKFCNCAVHRFSIDLSRATKLTL